MLDPAVTDQEARVLRCKQDVAPAVALHAGDDEFLAVFHLLAVGKESEGATHPEPSLAVVGSAPRVGSAGLRDPRDAFLGRKPVRQDRPYDRGL